MFKQIGKSFELSLLFLVLFFGFFFADSLNEEMLIAFFLVLMFRLIYIYTRKMISFYFLSKIEKLYVYFLYLIRLGIRLSFEVLKSLNLIVLQFNLFIIPYLYKFVFDFTTVLKKFESDYYFIFIKNLILNWIKFSLNSTLLLKLRFKCSSLLVSTLLSNYVFIKRVDNFFKNPCFFKSSSKD